jgi:KDO2-lipid IV(A) lauroyltransferase
MRSGGTGRPTALQRAEFAALRAVLGVTARMDDRAAEGLGERLGRLGFRPFGIRREVVVEQLRAAFPEHDAAWILSTARASYAHLGREMIVTLRMSRMSPEQLVRRTEIEGLPAADRALAKGRGMVLCAGHLGNWEIGAAAAPVRGYAFDAVVQRQSNPLFDRMLTDMRARFGLGVIERRQAPRLALRALRSGHVVAFVADQDGRGSGVFVPFFGRAASTHRGPALMALRTQAPMFVALPLRQPDGRYHIRVEEIDESRAGDPEDAVVRLTAAFTARLEAAIRTAPEQYLWHHRRWKTRPPAERRA